MPQESGDTFTESNGRIHSYLGYVHALLLSLPRQARTAVTSTCTAHRLWRTYILPLLKLCVCLIRTNEVSTWLGFGVFEVLSRSLASLCECCATRQQTVKRQPTMGHSTPGSMQTCMVAHQWCALLCASFSLPTSHCFASFSSLHANFSFSPPFFIS